LLAEAAPPAAPPPLDRSVAHSAGWRWEAASPVRTSHGLVYSSGHLSDSKAERVFRNAAAVDPREPAIQLRAGRRPEPWLRNCVAIGDSAVTVEPLEWTNLHLAHNAIDRVISMMPDRDCSAVELWDYNRQSEAEAMRVRDFLVLHYAVARRPSDGFWRDAACRELPPSLAHTLTQFRERGRLPFYEDETFAKDSWLAVLFGQGVIPRRTDPLLDGVPEIDSDRAMTQMLQSVEALVQTLPTHADYLRNLSRQAAR
jgi:tryptophan halogenase